MRVFMDIEFTGLHRNTTMLSLGAVAANGAEFYAELRDYDGMQVQQDPFVNEMVMPRLLWVQSENMQHTITRQELKGLLETWFATLAQTDAHPAEIWMDVPTYDWMLFVDLWGSATDLPETVQYIPHDLATLLWDRGMDPDINRYVIADMDVELQHNALWDARAAQACFQKLTQSAGNASPEAAQVQGESNDDWEEDGYGMGMIPLDVPFPGPDADEEEADAPIPAPAVQPAEGAPDEPAETPASSGPAEGGDDSA